MAAELCTQPAMDRVRCPGRRTRRQGEVLLPGVRCGSSCSVPVNIGWRNCPAERVFAPWYPITCNRSSTSRPGRGNPVGERCRPAHLARFGRDVLPPMRLNLTPPDRGAHKRVSTRMDDKVQEISLILRITVRPRKNYPVGSTGIQDLPTSFVDMPE